MIFVRRNVLLSLCLLSLSQPFRSVAQQPPPQTPAPPPPAQQKTPEPKPAGAEDQPDTSDGQTSFGLFYWLGPTHPGMRTGRAAAANSNPANLDFPGNNKPTPGAILSLPAGGQNTLRLSYFRTQGSGNTHAPTDLALFSTGYSKGDYLSAGYTLQNAKISLDYLSWPFPIRGSLRVKTLWEVQYTTVHSNFNAPLKPTTDSSGAAVDNTAKGTNWFIYPSFGMGVEKFTSQHFRLEAKASGFTLPHFSTIWDAEALAAYRRQKFEIVFGAKAFHFKTSPRREEYVRGTLSGGYVGLRWYP